MVAASPVKNEMWNNKHTEHWQNWLELSLQSPNEFIHPRKQQIPHGRNECRPVDGWRSYILPSNQMNMTWVLILHTFVIYGQTNTKMQSLWQKTNRCKVSWKLKGELWPLSREQCSTYSPPSCCYYFPQINIVGRVTELSSSYVLASQSAVSSFQVGLDTPPSGRETKRADRCYRGSRSNWQIVIPSHQGTISRRRCGNLHEIRALRPRMWDFVGTISTLIVSLLLYYVAVIDCLYT